MSRGDWRRKVDSIAREHGCEVVLMNGGHLRLKHPSGWFVHTASTPRNEKQARHHLDRDIRNAKQFGRA
jgi:hypothetical protein